MVRRIIKTNPAKPVYNNAGDQAVYRLLRQEVNEIVKLLEPERRKIILFKAFIFPILYLLIYIIALRYGNDPRVYYSAFFVMGILLVIIFLNIIHDAVHGTIFRKKWANNIFIRLFDLMGANSFIWQVRHVRFHHQFPNVNHWDTDIEQSNLFRVFPEGDYSPFHRYQHIYLPLLYPFYLVNWLLVRDFKDFFVKSRTVHKLVEIPLAEFVRLFVFKSGFLFYMIVIPKLLLHLSWLQVLGGFFIFLFTASIFSLLVLLTPHANTDNVFPQPDKDGKMPYSWMKHMMLTTNDISHNNFFTRFFMGCFNCHVAHHLFPFVNHIYYPEITERLRALAEEYKLPYREYTLFHSLKNHYLLLKQNRMQEDIFEETM